MEKILRIYIQFSFFIGIVLIISPLSYLLYGSVYGATDVMFDPNYERESLLGGIEEGKEESDIRIDSNVADLINKVKAENTGKLLPTIFDTNVPNQEVITHGFRLEIPSVGIDTVIYESYNSESALEKGVWRKPEYGAPDNPNQPTVLAAHRWGYDTDTWEHRAKNLFLNLPEIKNGDEIRITWNGNTYTYKVTKQEVNTYVTNLSDLILFTCEDYSSPERIFVYATLVSEV